MAATANRAKSKTTKKYAVGDKVFVVEYLRYSKKTIFGEGTVTKVGRKYFIFTVMITGDGEPWEKLVKAPLDRKVFTNHNNDSVRVYSSREEYELELEFLKSCEKIRKFFNHNWNLARELSLEQARQIVTILNIEKA